MSAQHKEILLRGNAAITAGNHEQFLALCTEETIWEFVGDRILKGKQAVRTYMAESYVEPPKFNVIDLISDGDLLTAVGEISLKDKNGEVQHYAYCDVWGFTDNKLSSLRAFVVEKK